MKKELMIQFNIIQYEDIKQQVDNIDLMVYSINNPRDESRITMEELQKSGVKKMIHPKMEKGHISDRFGKKFTYKITAEQLKELLDF